MEEDLYFINSDDDYDFLSKFFPKESYDVFADVETKFTFTNQGLEETKKILSQREPFPIPVVTEPTPEETNKIPSQREPFTIPIVKKPIQELTVEETIDIDIQIEPLYKSRYYENNISENLFTRFLSELEDKEYTVNELTSLINERFQKNLTEKGIGHMHLVKKYFIKKRKYCGTRHGKMIRATIYKKMVF